MYCYYKTQKELIKHLTNSQIIKSKEVKEAMIAVDRAFYSPESPYDDAPNSIGYGATISAPHMHAFCLELTLPKLKKPGCKVLDVGCGSGYLVACFASILKTFSPGGVVYGIDYVPQLVELSISNMKAGNPDLLDSNAFLQEGDGWAGIPDKAPFDVIHVGAAADKVPQSLLDQLAPGGVMLCPVGMPYEQYLMQYDKDETTNEIKSTKHWGVRYVALVHQKKQDESNI